MNRPPELEDFYIKHGKPLEVGLGVKVLNNFEFGDEYVVCGIVWNNIYKKIAVSLKRDLNCEVTPPESLIFKRFSPLDLEPII